MKFVDIILIILSITLIHSNCAKQNSENSELDNYINKGFSFLNNQANIIEDPSSVLSKYNIFDYKASLKSVLSNGTLPEFITVKKYTNTGISQVKLQDYTVQEIEKFNDFQMKGQKTLITNFLVRRSQLLGKKEKLNTIVYYHKVPAFSIVLNSKSNFPTFSQPFIRDAVEVFYEIAQKVEITDLMTKHKFIKQGLKFFTKYGTHYLSKLVFGSKFGIVTDMVENEIKKSGSQKKEVLTEDKTGSGLDKTINNINKYIFSNDRIVKLGKCKLDEKRKSISECDQSIENLNLISYHTKPIYELFNKQLYTAVVQLDGKEVPVTTLNVMKANAEILFKNLENAFRADAPIITQVDVFNNVKREYEDKLSCLKILKKNSFNTYNGNLKSILSVENVVDTNIPLFNLDGRNNLIKDNLELIENNSGFRSYACAKRRYATSLEDIINGKYFNRELVKDVSITTNNKLGKEWSCQQFWVATKKAADGSEDKIINYLCIHKTRNFLDKDLVVDIKFKRFQDKCENFTFNERKYTCDCKNDISSMLEDAKTKNIHLCLARRSS